MTGTSYKLFEDILPPLEGGGIKILTARSKRKRMLTDLNVYVCKQINKIEEKKGEFSLDSRFIKEINKKIKTQLWEFIWETDMNFWISFTKEEEIKKIFKDRLKFKLSKQEISILYGE